MIEVGIVFAFILAAGVVVAVLDRREAVKSARVLADTRERRQMQIAAERHDRNR